MLKQTLRTAARTVGLSVGKFPATDSLQGHLKSFFEKTGINCVIDVGAHLGEYGSEIREIGYKGRIVSFEPVRASHASLSARAAKDRDWRTQNFALGAAEGSQEINIYQGTVFNSFLSPGSVGTERFGEQVQLASKETVRIKRLDQVFDECIAGIAQPRVFLKMDTQGWDLKVLEGGRGVLDRLVGLQSELAVRETYDGMTGYTDALDQYAALGFEITGIFPVARETDGLRVMEFDCVLIRDKAAGQGK